MGHPARSPSIKPSQRLGFGALCPSPTPDYGPAGRRHYTSPTAGKTMKRGGNVDGMRLWIVCPMPVRWTPVRRMPALTNAYPILALDGVDKRPRSWRRCAHLSQQRLYIGIIRIECRQTPRIITRRVELTGLALKHRQSQQRIAVVRRAVRLGCKPAGKGKVSKQVVGV